MYKTIRGYSRIEIRKLTTVLRKVVGLEKNLYFPVMKVLEIFLPQFLKNYNYEVVDDSELNADAMYYPEETLIKIRQSVYDLACKDDVRARFTIAHEIGHCLMHSEKNVTFARNEYVPAYMDPEWQANTFAGELLAPPYLIGGMRLEEIADKCKVSKQVARIQSGCK